MIAVSFDDDRNADKAMTLLKELDAQERIVIQQAVVVERRQDGQVVEADRTESSLMLGTASGGVIGLLGGPLGVLIGGAANLADADKALDAAAEKRKKKLGAARTHLKRKAAARSRKPESDGLERYSLEATAGRSDLNALPELVRAQFLSHQ